MVPPLFATTPLPAPNGKRSALPACSALPSSVLGPPSISTEFPTADGRPAGTARLPLAILINDGATGAATVPYARTQVSPSGLVLPSTVLPTGVWSNGSYLRSVAEACVAGNNAARAAAATTAFFINCPRTKDPDVRSPLAPAALWTGRGRQHKGNTSIID